MRNDRTADSNDSRSTILKSVSALVVMFISIFVSIALAGLLTRVFTEIFQLGWGII